MKRRDFITLLGGAAAALPLALTAQNLIANHASAASCDRKTVVRSAI
jgi:hypothetical protein